MGVLDAYRVQAGLSHGELWLRYFELGGMSTALEVEGFLYGALVPTDHEQDLLALALNEKFREIGEPGPIPYLGTGPGLTRAWS